ncbi:MAG: (5-formylfuran-3-yl)methyl phosphate synthase [Methyloversatilis sp.]|uniref:(5-formylfuran-3-yl)methyl phosphate synthase n=1 Tax=Methyloversatilis sp. TaxID=2569862 RepID=UPI002735E561|nr:(5-formylfuran-3-yl)methyl phosphate synthase [Methyloversatilis sp.]MDP3872962.1 (5-formylfuran-3-yl)methyl phosphate synthase [Methyloversatilis sp.]
MLASVRDLAEAQIVLDAGVDLIDLKNPADGALGALPVDVIRAVVDFVAGRTITSATAGNIDPDASELQAAMARVAATGVDYVKAGLFPRGWAHGGRDYAGVFGCLTGLQALPGVRRIAVLFADLAPPLELVDAVAEAGFDGVMVDTALKQGASLCDVASSGWLADFIARAHGRGLMCGLAGSLRMEHIDAVAAQAPDYLGFRGALCIGAKRGSELDSEAVRRVRQRLRAIEHDAVV